MDTDKNAVWKWLILIVLLAASLSRVVPLKDKEGRDRIRLALDLKGGTRFTVEIDEGKVREEIKARYKTITEEDLNVEMKDALSDAPERALEVIRNRIDSLGINEPIIYLEQNKRIVIQLPGIDERARNEAKKVIESVAFLEFRMVHEDNEGLVGKLLEKRAAPSGYRTYPLDNTLYYKRDRSTVPDGAMDAAFYEQLSKFSIPDAEYEFILMKEEINSEIVYVPFFVKRRAEMKGDLLKNAHVGFDSFNRPLVSLEFDGKGAKAFSRVTSEYAPGGTMNPDPRKRRLLAVVLDGTIYSAPWIKEPIYSGKAEINGSFSTADALLLANVLRAGSLPAPVKIVEALFVDPSLGVDSIRNGIKAVVYGGIGVLIFMMSYYMVCGVVANLALVFNILLLPLGMIIAAGFMSLGIKDAGSAGPIQLPVLSLPGLAGIVLTVGMAVDACVLIFERMREELNSGKRLWPAIMMGYDKAFSAILDSNLTTLLTGMILFRFGSGPIRGFAVTLCAGIIVSMFTALVVTKLMFGIIASKTKLQTLKMLSIIKPTSFDFIKLRKVAALFSVVAIVASCGFAVVKGVRNPSSVLGVDFTGGSVMTFSFKDKVDVEQIRSMLTDAGIREAFIQYQGDMKNLGKDRYLEIKVASSSPGERMLSEIIVDALNADHAGSMFKLIQEGDVGAQVGAELKKDAIISIVLALLGMIIYLSWRFEFGFAAGAIVALIHDVLFTVGVFILFSRQISLPVIAALLTVVGYSVNDTIVIFDRIREDLRVERGKTFKDICNLSINQTLSRTLLTTFTTLITVVMLLVFGGGAIYDFALVLCIGMIVGVYSTMFIATPMVLSWHRGRTPTFAIKRK